MQSQFYQYPKFLLELPLNETTKLVYVLLLDRTKLSAQNQGWTDANGEVFVYFTIASLAQTLGKCEMTIKTSLAKLAQVGLLTRKRQGIGRPNRLYVHLPQDSDLPMG